jgi:hypothetical protein
MQMTHIELSRLCQLTFRLVDQWLKQQDERTRLIHEAVVETIQNGGEAPLSLVLHEIMRDRPHLWRQPERRIIRVQSRELLKREFQELSDLFTVFYKEFNLRFFANKLPAYDVKVFHNLPLPEQLSVESVCRNFRREGWLAFAYNRWPESMVTDLLHKMAHISTEADHGSAWQSEMDRIRRMGVLTYADVQRLRDFGVELSVCSAMAAVLGGSRDDSLHNGSAATH